MKILLIGSGPIVIGQAAEFDYAGSQACKALREEGHEVILINSNPATIMTDLEMSDGLYIEPLTVDFCRRIIERERPDALLPTLGGQTGLNLATQLEDAGILEEFNLKVLGTPLSAIKKAEDRESFRNLMREIKEPVPESWIIETPQQLEDVLDKVPYPCIIRPAYTLGGTGGGIANTREELLETGLKGLKLSMRSQIMVERSLLGWKEVEYEVMRDGAGNCITVCNMENFDPMGVHTGDSIVIAPSQTLSDIEYHMLRTASLKIIQALGIEGGCNVQLAVNPDSFDYYIIEVNPRVSRSSALASKATGYPIARVAAKIAVGKTLDQIENQVTGTTKACFEPALDYCVVKVPRWPFDKFASGDRSLFTQMKATGEVMAIDRTFESAIMKAVRGLEVKQKDLRHEKFEGMEDGALHSAINKPTDERLWAICEGLRRGMSIEEIRNLSRVDKWFLRKLQKLVNIEQSLVNLSELYEEGSAFERPDLELEKRIKEAFLNGFSSPTISSLIGITEEYKKDAEKFALKSLELSPLGKQTLQSMKFVQAHQKELATGQTPQLSDEEQKAIEEMMKLDWKAELENYPNSEDAKAQQIQAKEFFEKYDRNDPRIQAISNSYYVIDDLKDQPVFKMVDTCAGEFESKTPYYYGTFEQADDSKLDPDDKRETVIVLGSGPIRIGQGIEFDYSCVHCVWSLQKLGYRAIIVNNNPETVSTDFDTGDGLYFEPVTLEDVLDIAAHEKPIGAVVQFGGQTAINLATKLKNAGISVLGTDPNAIDTAEDRERFDALLSELNIPRPKGKAVRSLEEAHKIAEQVGYPVLVRPSFVLGGRAMEIVYNADELNGFYGEAESANPGQPVLIDQYLLGKEAEVDVISDGVDTLVPGIMEHIERAGVHSGDSMAVYPAVTLSESVQAQMVTSACKIARALGVKGLMNIQFVIQDEIAYVLEVNPRASRTVPYLSKVTGIPMVDLATRCMMGEKLTDLGYESGLWVLTGNSGYVIPEKNFENPVGLPKPILYAIKAPVFSFQKLAKVEPSLGPEMKSTGEILGIDNTFEGALYKALVASHIQFKGDGLVLLTVKDDDKTEALNIGKRLHESGRKIAATPGTARVLEQAGIPCEVVQKISEGSPNLLDLILSGQVSLMINTPSSDKTAELEAAQIRRACIETGIPCVTSIDTAVALVRALDVYADPKQSSCLRLPEYFQAAVPV